MDRKQLFENIKRKQSFLCVGLDSDITKIPQHLLSTENPILEFNKQIVDATAPYAIAYKPNLAFYETHGAKGIETLEATVKYIKANYPDMFIIADAKRGDIGNTSKMYAQAFLQQMNFDAITVAPYMGEDSIAPFLSFDGKWAIVLALNSNKGAADFQFIKDSEDGMFLFEKVIKKNQEWGTTDNMMFVVGATKDEMFAKVRAIAPNHFLLVPGVGAQGGSLAEVAKNGMNKECGLIVNSSRAIIYASNGEDFAEKAAEAAKTVADEMATLLKEYCK